MLSSSHIMAHSLQIKWWKCGSFNYAFVPNNGFTQASIDRLVRQAGFDKNIKVMVANNINEGLYFINQSIQNKLAFINTIQQAFSTIFAINTKYISNVLFPLVFNGSSYWKHVIGGLCALMVFSQPSKNKKRKTKLEKTETRTLMYNCLRIML